MRHWETGVLEWMEAVGVPLGLPIDYLPYRLLASAPNAHKRHHGMLPASSPTVASREWNGQRMDQRP